MAPLQGGGGRQSCSTPVATWPAPCGWGGPKIWGRGWWGPWEALTRPLHPADGAAAPWLLHLHLALQRQQHQHLPEPWGGIWGGCWGAAGGAGAVPRGRRAGGSHLCRQPCRPRNGTSRTPPATRCRAGEEEEGEHSKVGGSPGSPRLPQASPGTHRWPWPRSPRGFVPGAGTRRAQRARSGRCCCGSGRARRRSRGLGSCCSQGGPHRGCPCSSDRRRGAPRGPAPRGPASAHPPGRLGVVQDTSPALATHRLCPRACGNQGGSAGGKRTQRGAWALPPLL